MDGNLVQRLAQECNASVLGASVRRAIPVRDGLVLDLQRNASLRFEVGFALYTGAAWAWLLKSESLTALRTELQSLAPEYVAAEAKLEFRPAGSPLDALRAWILQPGRGHSAWGRLEGTELVSVEPLGGDRILRLEFAARSAVGQISRFELILELFDTGGNWILRDATAEIGNRRRRSAAAPRDAGGNTPLDDHTSLLAAAHLGLGRAAATELARLHGQAMRQSAVRLARRLQKLAVERRDAAAAETWRRSGELLAANLHRVRRGSVRVTVEDLFADGAEREIELDPTLSPQENVALLFKRARRAARGEQAIADRQVATQLEYERLGREIDALTAQAAARDWPGNLSLAVSTWQSECPLATSTPLPVLWSAGGPGWRGAEAVGSKRQEAAPDAGPGRRFELPGGWEVRVGRSNADNDALTHRFARPDDVWLHASGVSGSHVILRMQGRTDNPPRQVLEAAAALAARYSKAKHAGTVPVVWTRKRYVRKPRGGAAGLAVCTHEKTVFVRPARDDGAPDGG